MDSFLSQKPTVTFLVADAVTPVQLCNRYQPGSSSAASVFCGLLTRHNKIVYTKRQQPETDCNPELTRNAPKQKRGACTQPVTLGPQSKACGFGCSSPIQVNPCIHCSLLFFGQKTGNCTLSNVPQLCNKGQQAVGILSPRSECRRLKPQQDIIKMMKIATDHKLHKTSVELFGCMRPTEDGRIMVGHQRDRRTISSCVGLRDS